MWRKLIGGVALSVVGALCFTVLLTAAPSESPIADAAMWKDASAVQALLKQGADVNAAQPDGMTALHWAAMSGDAQMAKMLLYAGAHAGVSTRVGALTPLDLAAKNGYADVVEVLLSRGADPKAADLHGTTPLMLAAASGSTQALAELLKAGADVNAKESTKGESALMFAAAYGRANVVKVLMANGADWRPASKILDWTKLPKDDPRLIVFMRPQSGATVKKTGTPPNKDQKAIASASEVQQKAGQQNKQQEERPLTYVQLVGTQGGLTALMLAARQGDLDTVKALVEGGADVNEVSPGDKTSPLLIAVINGRFDASMYLLGHNANPNLAPANGAAPLYAVLNCQWAPKAEYPHPLAYAQQNVDYLQLMKALLEHGANSNARLTRKVWYSNYNDDQSGVDEVGATPFWRAAYGDDVEAMKLLVAYGADPNVPTTKPAGRWPTGAQGYGDNQIKDQSALLPIPVGGPGVPPLLAASGEGYGWSFTANHHRYAPSGMLPAVTYLIEVLHADVNVRDADGNTALHNAASRGDNAMVQYLVSKGADPKALNRGGQTVADMANGPFQRTQPFPETIALLAKLGVKVLHKCVSC